MFRSLCKYQKKTLSKATHPASKACQVNCSAWDHLNNLPTKKNTPWTSATGTRNFLLNDPILDWLELHYCQLGLNDKNEKVDKVNKANKANMNEWIKKSNENMRYLNILFQKGFDFEDKIMKELESKYNNNFTTINEDGREGRTRKNFDLTKDAIFSGVPIISQAVLFNDNNHTMGTADLLVRSDYLNKLVHTDILSDEDAAIKASKLDQYHYRVIDIKWSSLKFYANSNCLKKQGFIPAYKGQLAIYNCALGNIQGYFPSQAYLMGKGCEQMVKGNKVKFFDCFDRLGMIDYENKDRDFINLTAEAVQWYREVKQNGKKWSPLDPPKKKHPNLFPNMSNDDIKWNPIKKEIAQKTGELTQLSYVGINERESLHTRGIYTINNPACTTQNMEMKPSLNSEKVDAICQINRDPKHNISPRGKIDNNDGNWQKTYPTDMYFDFENINVDFVKTKMDIHNSQTDIMIFMIGVGYIQNDQWNYKTFYMKNATPNEEKRIFNEFTEFVDSKSYELDPEQNYPVRLFHWSQAEITNISDMNGKFDNQWKDFSSDTEFVDMYNVFNKEPIGIKGAFGYSLKSVGNALYKLGYIESKWPESNISNGQNTLFAAGEYYLKKNEKKITNEDKKTFNDIINYNEIDCKMIWEVVEFLRKRC